MLLRQLSSCDSTMHGLSSLPQTHIPEGPTFEHVLALSDIGQKLSAPHLHSPEQQIGSHEGHIPLLMHALHSKIGSETVPVFMQLGIEDAASHPYSVFPQIHMLFDTSHVLDVEE